MIARTGRIFDRFRVHFWLATLLLACLAACGRPLPFPTPGQELVVITTQGPLTYSPSAVSDQDGETQFEVSGLEHDLASAFARDLEAEIRFVVVDPEDVLSSLSHHKGHLAAAWLTRPASSGVIAGPQIGESHDVLVQSPDALPIRRVEQLAGKKVSVLSGSRQHMALKQLQADGLDIRIDAADGVGPLRLMDRVFNHQIDLALVDSAAVHIGLNFYPTLDTTMNVGKPYPITWLFPADGNASLRERAVSFIETAQRTGMLKRITDQYLGHLERLGQVNNMVLLQKMKTVLPGLREEFIEAEKETGIDWRLLAALAYQESGWDPMATSYTNVRGIMMLTEDTADQLGVTNRLDSRQSIMAGARYLEMLKRQLPASVQGQDRNWQAIAAYNVGPGSLASARSFAQKKGLNPDSWFDMKKALPMYAQVSSARGGEAVIMVENIRLMYSTLQRFEPAYVPRSSFLESVLGRKKKEPSSAHATPKKGASKPPAKKVLKPKKQATHTGSGRPAAVRMRST